MVKIRRKSRVFLKKHLPLALEDETDRDVLFKRYDLIE